MFVEFEGLFSSIEHQELQTTKQLWHFVFGAALGRPFWPDIGGALQVQSRNQIQWNGEAGVVFVLVLVSPQRIHTSPHVTYGVSPVRSSAVRYT